MRLAARQSHEPGARSDSGGIPGARGPRATNPVVVTAVIKGA
jgi:hypothetical protein